jgi:hypothetical protein
MKCAYCRQEITDNNRRNMTKTEAQDLGILRYLSESSPLPYVHIVCVKGK